MMKRVVTAVATVALLVSLGSSRAQALSLSDPGVLGTITDASPFTDLTALVWMNVFLALPPSTGPITPVFETYTRDSTPDGGSGFVLGVGASGSGTAAASGFEYVMAKYGGSNTGGAVIYYTGGAALNLQATSSGLWQNASGSGYNLLGWKAFNATRAVSVFDGGSTMTLLGLGTFGLGLLRRFSR